jgi:hypothetical protein
MCPRPSDGATANVGGWSTQIALLAAPLARLTANQAQLLSIAFAQNFGTGADSSGSSAIPMRVWVYWRRDKVGVPPHATTLTGKGFSPPQAMGL